MNQSKNPLKALGRLLLKAFKGIGLAIRRRRRINAEKAKDRREVKQLKADIETEQARMKSLKLEIGEHYWERCESGAMHWDEEINEVCCALLVSQGSVAANLTQIKELQEKVYKPEKHEGVRSNDHIAVGDEDMTTVDAVFAQYGGLLGPGDDEGSARFRITYAQIDSPPSRDDVEPEETEQHFDEELGVAYEDERRPDSGLAGDVGWRLLEDADLPENGGMPDEVGLPGDAAENAGWCLVEEPVVQGDMDLREDNGSTLSERMSRLREQAADGGFLQPLREDAFEEGLREDYLDGEYCDEDYPEDYDEGKYRAMSDETLHELDDVYLEELDEAIDEELYDGEQAAVGEKGDGYQFRDVRYEDMGDEDGRYGDIAQEAMAPDVDAAIYDVVEYEDEVGYDDVEFAAELDDVERGAGVDNVKTDFVGLDERLDGFEPVHVEPVRAAFDQVTFDDVGLDRTILRDDEKALTFSEFFEATQSAKKDGSEPVDLFMNSRIDRDNVSNNNIDDAPDNRSAERYVADDLEGSVGLEDSDRPEDLDSLNDAGELEDFDESADFYNSEDFDNLEDFDELEEFDDLVEFDLGDLDADDLEDVGADDLRDAVESQGSDEPERSDDLEEGVEPEGSDDLRDADEPERFDNLGDVEPRGFDILRDVGDLLDELRDDLKSSRDLAAEDDEVFEGSGDSASDEDGAGQESGEVDPYAPLRFEDLYVPYNRNHNEGDTMSDDRKISGDDSRGEDRGKGGGPNKSNPK
ncbi:MAG: hypothetical protein FWF88_05810 [Peptococcaceae bacterium]|nr:hypothetical protein [Peptococcaceae bacterium]